jgi:tryptophan synthase alpha chain
LTSTERTSRTSTRISARLATGRKALVGYITAGDGDTPELVSALVRGGVDILELGVPFSDPIADGPVIQRASERALRAGTTLRKVLGMANTIRREHPDLPLILFTYMNPVVRYGVEALSRDAAAAGIDGVLLTDLSVEEAEPYVDGMRAAGLDTIFLAAPTSTERRMRLIAGHSSGFVYLVSRTGVTGEQTSVSQSVAPLVAAMRRVTDLPLAVGFGISRREHVAAVAAVADAVVVGSAFVRAVESGADLEALARDLKGGIG